MLVTRLQNFFVACKLFFHTYHSSIFLSAFFVFSRVLSVGTYHSATLNHSIAAVGLIFYFYICKNTIRLGWAMLMAELLLGSGGHFFEFQRFIVRTWMLGICLLWWGVHTVQKKKIPLPHSSLIKKSLLMVGGVLVVSIVQGFLLHHHISDIVQDALMYGFVFLVFPALEFFPALYKKLPSLLWVFIFASALWSVGTFFLYTSHAGTLPDTYYHWFRNSAGGKITDLGNNFFRVVLPEHIFIVPLLLVGSSLLLYNNKNKKIWFGIYALSTILMLNFSRIYFIALAVGMVVLFRTSSYKKWLRVSAGVMLSLILSFWGLYLIGSRGTALGFELIENKIAGVTSPQLEISGNTRLLILQNAVQTFATHPWQGSGLGTTITYVDPTTQKTVTRTQFDWGYIEMLTELGIIGTGLFLFFLSSILFLLHKKFLSSHEENAVARGLFAGGISLFIMNLTTPALFQGFGILYFVFLLVYVEKYTPKDDAFEK